VTLNILLLLYITFILSMVNGDVFMLTDPVTLSPLSVRVREPLPDMHVPCVLQKFMATFAGIGTL
jgi:hypothetical protein